MTLFCLDQRICNFSCFYTLFIFSDWNSFVLYKISHFAQFYIMHNFWIYLPHLWTDFQSWFTWRCVDQECWIGCNIISVARKLKFLYAFLLTYSSPSRVVGKYCFFLVFLKTKPVKFYWCIALTFADAENIEAWLYWNGFDFIIRVLLLLIWPSYECYRGRGGAVLATSLLLWTSAELPLLLLLVVVVVVIHSKC